MCSLLSTITPFFFTVFPSAKHISISSYLSLTDHLDSAINIKETENIRSMTFFSGFASSVKYKTTSMYENVLKKGLTYYFAVRI